MAKLLDFCQISHFRTCSFFIIIIFTFHFCYSFPNIYLFICLRRAPICRFFCFTISYLFISFACPKETNQRKRQPQIFFGLNIFKVAHTLQLASPRFTRFRSNSNAYLKTLPSQLLKCQSISKKDLKAFFALRRFCLKYEFIENSVKVIICFRGALGKPKNARN